MGWDHRTHFEWPKGKIRCGIETSKATDKEDQVTCGHCKNHRRRDLEKHGSPVSRRGNGNERA
jgi:hypothetical protein